MSWIFHNVSVSMSSILLFLWHSICHTLATVKLLSKMSNEIFIQFHILEKITVGNLNIKYIEFYKVSVVLWESPINYELDLSGPEIWAANVTPSRFSHPFKHIKKSLWNKATYWYFSTSQRQDGIVKKYRFTIRFY